MHLPALAATPAAALVLPSADLPQPPWGAGQLVDIPPACKTTGSYACSLIFDWTGNAQWAQIAAWLIGKPLMILGLVLLAVFTRWVLHRLIDRVVRRTELGVVPRLFQGTVRGDPVSPTIDHVSARRTQRVKAMASLLKSIVTGVVFTVVAMMVIGELGYNLGPVLAGAGILGVALGFGSQTLVKDFLSGIFMIFEDQYGVGDVIDVNGGEAVGTVEAVSLRVTRLRDVDGTVWYVRNGEVLRIGNMSQNWARTVLDIPVPYTADLPRVRGLLAEVAHELYEDEAFAGDIIEEPEIWGVQSLDPDAVVIRVTLKTAPLEQWAVAREMRERLKARLDAEGITLLRPQRIVWENPEAGPARAR